MKKVYQEIVMNFWVDDDVDIDEVLFEMDIDIKDTTGKIEMATLIGNTDTYGRER